MSNKNKKTLFIFRRDLRVSNNTALYFALKESQIVIPCFIFDPRQVKNNKYKSNSALHFLIESIEELIRELKQKNRKFYIFYGNAEEIVSKLINEERIDAVYFNKDYTPFSIKRDSAIEKICKDKQIICKTYDDVLLNKPGSIINKSGKPYTIFTPFYKNSALLPVEVPKNVKPINLYDKSIKSEYKKNIRKLLATKSLNLVSSGGRNNVIKILKSIRKFNDYEKLSDFPGLDATTHLSPHLKFGTCSVREVYYTVRKRFGVNHPLIKQLYWRDFFYHIAFHFPHVFGKPFYRKYSSLKWSKNKKGLNAWCKGTTGFPIVDAGMRELNTTGYMHNRVRMIVASFLTKDLHIDWQKGEKYFAQRLVDYDPCINNGNWQWAASTGCDAQPYFRIFNPWRQQERFDPECRYIKKWLPELSELEPKQIHNLWTNQNQY